MRIAHTSKVGQDGPQDIKTEPRYEGLVPRMLEQEFDELKESIRTDGQLEPIIVNQDHVVLDGHHRLRACRELGRVPKFEVKSFESREDEKVFAITVNLQRRHLNSFQRIELAFKLEAAEADKAHKRRMEAPQRDKAGPTLGQNHPNGKEKGRVIDRCAVHAGVSADTYRKAREIIRRGPEELKSRVRNGQLSIDRAYRKLARKVIQKDNKPSLAEQSTVDDDEMHVDMIPGPGGEDLERHFLTKEECEKFGAIGAKMNYRDRCYAVYDQGGQLLSLSVGKIRKFPDELG